jgi:hypothetical protein
METPDLVDSPHLEFSRIFNDTMMVQKLEFVLSIVKTAVSYKGISIEEESQKYIDDYVEVLFQKVHLHLEELGSWNKTAHKIPSNLFAILYQSY